MALFIYIVLKYFIETLYLRVVLFTFAAMNKYQVYEQKLLKDYALT